MNIWGLSNIFEREEKYKQYQLTEEEWIAKERYENYYEPKIDSLLDTNPELAISFIDKTLKKYPNEYFLHVYKGIGLYAIDSFKLADLEFKKSMKIGGHEFPKALAYSGFALAELKNYEEAIVQLKKAADSNSDYNYDLGQVYELNENFSKAVKCYNFEIKRIKELYPLTHMTNENIKKEIRFIENKITELNKKL